MKKTFLLNPVAGLKDKISYHIFNRNMEGKATQKAEVVPQPMAPLPEVTICPGLGKSADAKITQYDKNNLKVIKKHYFKFHHYSIDNTSEIRFI